MEAVRVFRDEDFAFQNEDYKIEQVVNDLKQTYENLIKYLFGQNIQMRWMPAYFPFTEPSFELEIYFNDQWVEMLGCGILRKEILKNFNQNPEKQIAWASGIGMERFAMLLFQIPDVRLFWSKDERFLKQFQSGEIVKFQSFSKYPSCFKDVSFWLPDDKRFEINNLYEIVRNHGGDLIEKVEQVDQFTNKQNRESRCFRIHYRSLERTLNNAEVMWRINNQIDEIQFKIRADLTDQLNLALR